MKRQTALRLAWSLHGTPYIWGGDDPIEGFDCSGFVIEILKSVGALPAAGDWTAHGLWQRFRAKRVNEPIAGALVFYGSRDRVTHVEMCIDQQLAIGAGGGGSRTRTRADAVEHNAYVRIRPISIRSDVVGYVDPFTITLD